MKSKKQNILQKGYKIILFLSGDGLKNPTRP